MFDFKTPVTNLPKIGLSIAKKLKNLEIFTLKDLLYHFPYRYDDYRQILTIAQLKTRDSGVVRGKIKFITNKRSFKSFKAWRAVFLSYFQQEFTKLFIGNKMC